ncbi:MAG: CBS domain-containing protein [Spirochaetales bacterium]|nr:CBS domain-containing protein [Spirochaetales bacterium]
MNIIVGHTNMDLDCFGSIALARYLYPGYTVIKSRLIHPVARNLYTMFHHHLDMVDSGELRNQQVGHMVVVDTRSRGRVAEYLDLLSHPPQTIEVFDHHPADSRDIPEAVFHESSYGANTTLLGKMLMDRGVALHPDDATIALTGLCADTGNFTHENVTAEDFAVASFLHRQKASMKLVKTFLYTLREKYQITLFHEVLNRLIHRNIQGHDVLISYMELEKQAQGLSAVVEKIFEVEDPDVYFAVFHLKHNGNVLIIARNQKDSIDLDRILNAFGGGGHTKAASATVKQSDGNLVLETLLSYLQASLKPARTAASIMTEGVYSLEESMSLLEASRFLERVNHTGCPVLNSEGAPVGFITLRDIMKGRKAEQMNAPVRSYMTRKLITADIGTPLREVEHLLLTHNIGHLPILSRGALVGIITRSDYLSFRKAEQDLQEVVLEALN